ncbi:hypothetical protein [Celeribacter sp.]|uniref:hypothetical protein n=1 Tax=Celeribacter sp. TaxID=1890673 RepID=UPI003A944851
MPGLISLTIIPGLVSDAMMPTEGRALTAVVALILAEIVSGDGVAGVEDDAGVPGRAAVLAAFLIVSAIIVLLLYLYT